MFNRRCTSSSWVYKFPGHRVISLSFSTIHHSSTTSKNHFSTHPITQDHHISTMSHTGQCLCGASKVVVKSKQDGQVACHCMSSAVIGPFLPFSLEYRASTHSESSCMGSSWCMTDSLSQAPTASRPLARPTRPTFSPSRLTWRWVPCLAEVHPLTF